MAGYPVAFEQLAKRRVAEAFDRELGAMLEQPDRARRMYPAEETAEPLPVVFGREFRPASAAPLEDGEPVTGMRVQRLAVEAKRRHDRDLLRRELERKGMLLENRLVGPAARPVELGDDEAVFGSDLEDAVFVAVEREQAARDRNPDRFHRIENPVRGEIGVRHRIRHAGIIQNGTAARWCQTLVSVTSV